MHLVSKQGSSSYLHWMLLSFCFCFLLFAECSVPCNECNLTHTCMPIHGVYTSILPTVPHQATCPTEHYVFVMKGIGVLCNMFYKGLLWQLLTLVRWSWLTRGTSAQDMISSLAHSMTSTTRVRSPYLPTCNSDGRTVVILWSHIE